MITNFAKWAMKKAMKFGYSGIVIDSTNNALLFTRDYPDGHKDYSLFSTLTSKGEVKIRKNTFVMADAVPKKVKIVYVD